jgi:ADP-heptose:LPS heptosyltransferase
MTHPAENFIRGVMSEQVLLPIEPKKILVPRFDTIGDIILLEGFLEALVQSFPRAKVTLLTRRVYADLASLFPDSLDWLTTEIDPHKQPPDLSLCKKLFEELDGASWDLVLMTAYNRTWADDLTAARLIKTKRIAVGQWTKMSANVRRVFAELGLSVDCPYEQLVPVSEKSHEIEKYQTLWRALRCESTLPEPRLYVNEHQYPKVLKKSSEGREAGLKLGVKCATMTPAFL